MQQNGDWVAATDRVAKLALIRCEARSILRLDESHALLVELLYRLEDLAPMLGVVVGEVEPLAPVAKIARDDEEVLWVGEVGSEQPADERLGLLRKRTDHYGHERRIGAAKKMHKVRHVHLEAVLSLVHCERHLIKEAAL